MMKKDSTILQSLEGFGNYSQVKQVIGKGIDEDKIAENREMIEQEIESMASILNTTEFSVVDNIEDTIISSDASLSSHVHKLVLLSLIPTSSSWRFLIRDLPKSISIELRCLPPLEILVALPDSYPSDSAPLIKVKKTSLYEGMEGWLVDRLGEKWAEGNMVMYECVYYVQDEFLTNFFDDYSSGEGDKYQVNKDNKQIEIGYK